LNTPTEWKPRKPRLHTPSRVRVPTAPLHYGPFNYASDVFLERLKARRLPPSLAAIIEDEKRANRSDGLESIWMVVFCLLAFTSIKSFRVGYRKRRDRWKRDLVGVTVEKIATFCGLDDRTVSGVLTILRRAGYVDGPSDDGVNHINQPWETVDGAYKPLPAIRRFTFAFFAELGDVGSLIALKRAGTTKPTPTATVSHASVADVVAELANTHALEPPDSS